VDLVDRVIMDIKEGDDFDGADEGTEK